MSQFQEIDQLLQTQPADRIKVSIRYGRDSAVVNYEGDRATIVKILQEAQKSHSALGDAESIRKLAILSEEKIAKDSNSIRLAQINGNRTFRIVLAMAMLFFSLVFVFRLFESLDKGRNYYVGTIQSVPKF